jgi:cytidyltransferase-like protein
MRIYTEGIFDLFHYGHGLAFENIKNTFPGCILIVGVVSDSDAASIKRRPILTEEERVESICHSRWVDGVIDSIPMNSDVDLEFLQKHSIDMVAHEDNGSYEFLKALGIFYAIPYTEGISTTSLIERIERISRLPSGLSPRKEDGLASIALRPYSCSSSEGSEDHD